MILDLLGALGAAVAYGVASVLQAVGARRADAYDAEQGGSLVRRLAREGPFVAGLACDGLGALLSLAALRSLPLFLVQAAVASALAVTAVVASRVFHRPLERAEWAGVAAVVVGLALLGSAASADGATASASLALRISLLVAAIALAGLGVLGARRLHGPRGAAVLGLVAGLSFGTGSMSVPVLASLAPSDLIGNPATAAVVIGAGSGLLLLAVALQRGSVTSATAAMVVGETVLPTVFGLVVLHQRPRSGFVPVAVIGFAAAVVGAVLLSHFGEIESSGVPAESDRPTETAPAAVRGGST